MKKETRAPVGALVVGDAIERLSLLLRSLLLGLLCSLLFLCHDRFCFN